ncbi:MAG: beta-lactamase domain-containing protein [Candidatus Saganbacteria bacterium]|uniref:Beta-lactamase domain-containing protein n=1 Tax=Candidatus Saganbacteria bacterium TaxID=2575572 RepID=A0A833L4G6_UNCSA|nr:MAG: beta-lactamase domain-containing protein [Candidatus Saganbacteria bacterium]
MYQLLKIHIDENNIETWNNLARLPAAVRKEWFAKHLKDVLKTLEQVKTNFKNQNPWHQIGFLLIDDTLYKEAESIYNLMYQTMQKAHSDFGSPAYYRGISRFLQGRFKEAYEDFRIAHQYDLHMKNFNTPSTRAIAYMEETIFPTREIIRKNQEILIKDLNDSRKVEYKIGANVLRTIHKWNSASPLFSHGLSQGGGYFLTLRSAKGEVKGIAIDPGYDFYDIFRNLGLGIADIDAIIITHDHDDHTESVEGILSLLAKFNDHNQEKKTKVLDIFGSSGVLLKFHGLLSATDLFGNKEINYKLLVPGNNINEIEGKSLIEKYGFTMRINPAYHSERWTNQESSVGIVVETSIKDKNGEQLKIGITGDSRYVEGLGKLYSDCQVILLNIGSMEKEEGKLLTQHLGLLGCINLLKEARLNKPGLAILTEFGEEFSGKREIISKIIENWVQPLAGLNSGKSFAKNELRVIPADVNLEIKLQDLSIRESETNIFLPYQNIKIDETSPELIKYKFNG